MPLHENVIAPINFGCVQQSSANCMEHCLIIVRRIGQCIFWLAWRGIFTNDGQILIGIYELTNNPRTANREAPAMTNERELVCSKIEAASLQTLPGGIFNENDGIELN